MAAEQTDEDFEVADEEFVDEELDEEVLDEDLDEDLDDEAIPAEPIVDDDETEEEAAPAEERPRARKKAGEEEEDEEEDLHPDDVEADLDTILKDRIAASEDEEEEPEEEEEEAAGGAAARVTPMKASEFVCASCFLVKNVTQRVTGRDICRDCE